MLAKYNFSLKDLVDSFREKEDKVLKFLGTCNYHEILALLSFPYRPFDPLQKETTKIFK